MSGGVTVGSEVATTAFKDANETEGGMIVGDVGVEAEVRRRESRRAPRGFDDPDMDAKSYTLVTQERIEGEAEADRRSDALAERFEGVRESAADEGVEIEGRAERCRAEVTSGTHYERTSCDERPDVGPEFENPFEELTQDQLAKVNQQAAKMEGEFGPNCHLGRASFANLLARRVAEGSTVLDATLAVKEAVLQFPDVEQPIADIDPFDQYQTTVEGTIDVLWEPKGKGQYQVGLISDDSDERVKITVWQKSGKKPLLKEGDKIRAERVKVNAYQRGGEWETTLAVDAEAEIHHVEHGDGDAPRMRIHHDEHEPPAWRADSKTHKWLIESDVQEGGDEADLDDAKTEAINAWIRGEITEGEIDEYAASLKK
ncbi:hypothetical protein ACOZ4L_15380 (plasmid) [Haloplanus ruber]|uniref:Replication factor A n=1 Tax=Haloplanus ruber TaxID=869892 RepID=A0ABD6CVE3_9EURY|nr:hypothetical protein [Haloplanus ruber]